jgi:hypothetical protein
MTHILKWLEELSQQTGGVNAAWQPESERRPVITHRHPEVSGTYEAEPSMGPNAKLLQAIHPSGKTREYTGFLCAQAETKHVEAR